MTIFECYKKRFYYFNNQLDVIYATPGHSHADFERCRYEAQRMSEGAIRMPLKYLSIDIGDVDESVLYSSNATDFYEHIAKGYRRRIDEACSTALRSLDD